MKSTFLGFCLAIAALSAAAQEHADSYNKSVFSRFHDIRSVQRHDPGQTVQKVQQHFPGMKVSVDKLNNNFTDVFGTALIVPGNSLNDKVSYCFSQHLADLGVIAGEWQQVRHYNAPHASFVSYVQYINGHKVAFSKLNFRFTNDGRLQRLQMKNYGAPSGSLTATLSKDDAKLAAAQDLDGVTIIENNIDNDWYWFPVPSPQGYALRPAYAFNIKGTGGHLPVDLNGYVDAATGEVLYRSNSVKETVNQTVQGNVYKQNPLVASSNEPLANLKMTIGGTDYFTDTAGVLDVPSLSVPVTATVKLEGLWSKVIAVSSGSVTPNYQNPINTNGTVYTFPATAPSGDRHVNAYYHVNKVHDFMKQQLPSFTQMDFMLPTNVDVSGSCNAYYNGSSINFMTAGSGCISFAECGDIVYHEYGHGISDMFYNWQGQGTIFNGALNEGNSDIWGISITHDPVLGKGSSTGGIIRRYDLTPKVYPQDIQGEVHADGEIIAGAWWDVAVNINSVDTMTMLFTKTYFDVPDGPDGTEGDVYHDVLISALQNDDNDNNLNNGTPHFSQIIAAFARHGIYLLGDAALTHTDIPNQPSNTPISISATLTLTTPAFFQDLKLFYRPRGGQWDSLAMTTQGGNIYTTQIPAQPAGTLMDYYFAVYDNVSMTRNISFPQGYHPSLAASKNTIPYQFGIGLDKKTGTDFESPVTGWTIGNGPGDNATSGLWTLAKPIGSYVASAAATIYVQPDADHTTGTTGMCLVTGNASIPSSNIGAADVDAGRTTVITPVFDVSGFSDPVIEYYRWYSNDAGSNPGQDYWRVYIKDSAMSAWPFSVEYTLKSDNTWRRRIFKLKQYLTVSTKFMMKFQAEDNTPGSAVEAAVDDIFIYDKEGATGVGNVNPVKAGIYPNPANREINIKLSEPSDGFIALYDLTGKQIIRTDIANTSEYTINTANVTAGVYFVMIQTGKFVQSHKITIAH